MTVEHLRTQLRSLQTYLARQRRVEEYLIAAFEQLVLSCVTRARSAGVTDEQITSVAPSVLQDFIGIAEDLGHPLSSEIEDLIRDCATAGHAFCESRPRRPNRPLAAAPKGPVEFSVFVDESGTPSFDESAQPVLCLAGVIVRDDAIPGREGAAECLLEKSGLPRDVEFHASEFLTATPKPPLDSLSWFPDPARVRTASETLHTSVARGSDSGRDLLRLRTNVSIGRSATTSARR